MADDCRQCGPCRDKPKYGGTGKLKQACVHRKCVNLVLRPPPTVRTNQKVMPQADTASLSQRKDIIKQSTQNGTNARRKKKRTMPNSNDIHVNGHVLYRQIAVASARLGQVYGTAGPGMFPWKTSVLGTIIGLICAQNTTNSFSAIMYNNLVSLCPDTTGRGEADWDRLSRKSPIELKLPSRVVCWAEESNDSEAAA